MHPFGSSTPRYGGGGECRVPARKDGTRRTTYSIRGGKLGPWRTVPLVHGVQRCAEDQARHTVVRHTVPAIHTVTGHTPLQRNCVSMQHIAPRLLAPSPYEPRVAQDHPWLAAHPQLQA